MIFLILGLIFTVCKWQELGPIAAWSWWIALAPYALAALWWAWASKKRSVNYQHYAFHA